MKKFSFPLIVLLSITAMSSCRNKQAEVNPLLAPWDTPYEVPPFDKIEIRHYKPAVEQAIVPSPKGNRLDRIEPGGPGFRKYDRGARPERGNARPGLHDLLAGRRSRQQRGDAQADLKYRRR